MESDVKVQRGPRTAAAIQSVGAGLPTQAQDQCDCDWPGTCDWEGTQMSVAESCSPTLHIDHVAWRSLRYLLYLSLQCRCQTTANADGAVPRYDPRSTFRRVGSLHDGSTYDCGHAIVGSGVQSSVDADGAGRAASSSPSANATNAESRCKGQGATGGQGFGHTGHRACWPTVQRQGPISQHT